MGNRDRLPFSYPNLEGEIAISQEVTPVEAFGVMNSMHTGITAWVAPG